MKMGARWKKNSLLAAVIASILVVGVLWTTGIYFETNDDKCIAEILAGVIAPAPDAHVIYVNYLLTLPLSLLYRITAQIPWYGGMLILFQGVAYGLMFYSLYERCKNRKEYILSTAVGLGFFFMAFYMTGQIQYTSTAALLAASGYVCLLLWGYGRKGMVFFVLLELLAFLLRDQAMLMMQPLGFAICVGIFLGRKEWSRKECFARLAAVPGAVIAICLFGIIGNAIGYADADWREYDKANEARTLMFDYYGAPSYEQAKPILEKYGVTEVSYTAYLNYVMPYEEITPECAQELAAYSASHWDASPGILQIVKTMVRYLILENCYGLNYLVLVLWVIMVALLLWQRRLSLLCPVVALGIARIAVWSYLIVKGRLPLRLIIPLFACEAMMLMVILWMRQVRIVYAVSVVFCIMACWVGVSQLRHVTDENRRQETVMREYKEILEYCGKQEENRYLLDAVSFSIYEGNSLETEIYRQGNHVVTGNWYSGSPVMQQYMEQFWNEEEQSDVCLIVQNDGRLAEHPAVKYLEEMTGESPKQCENFEVSSGKQFLIWYFHFTR